jgi:Arc/MetJ family transcription regulator
LSPRKKDRQKRNSVSPAVAPQNIEITHDLIATADRVTDHTQRIINLKN